MTAGGGKINLAEANNQCPARRDEVPLSEKTMDTRAMLGDAAGRWLNHPERSQPAAEGRRPAVVSLDHLR